MCPLGPFGRVTAGSFGCIGELGHSLAAVRREHTPNLLTISRKVSVEAGYGSMKSSRVRKNDPSCAGGAKNANKRIRKVGKCGLTELDRARTPFSA